MSVLCEKSKDDVNVSTDQNSEIRNVVDKFKMYRLNMESSERKLKEAVAVIIQLKKDVKLSREVEDNMRSQISSSENRLLKMQEALTKLIEKHRVNQNSIQEIDQKVSQLTMVVEEVRKDAYIVLNKATKEMTLLQTNSELSSLIKKKESELCKIKTEMKLMRKDGNEQKVKYEKIIQSLQNELEKSRSEITQVKSKYDETILDYKTQLEKKERILKEYEMQRKHFLEEFQPPRDEKLEVCDDQTAKPDSTVVLQSPERWNSTDYNTCTDEETKPLQIGRSARHLIAKKHRNQGMSKGIAKHRDQLHFLTNQDPSQFSLGPFVKRRLYSTNYNNYITY